MNTNKLTYIVLGAFLLLSKQLINAQAFGQDANGFSTIVFPVSNLNIDGNNNIISLSFNQLKRVRKKPINNDEASIAKCFLNENNDLIKTEQCVDYTWRKDENKYQKENSYALYGFELTGSSKNGVAFIFDNELLANSAKINGTLGYYFKSKKYNRKHLSEYVSQKIEFKKRSDKEHELTSDIIELVDQMALNGEITNNQKSKFLVFASIGNVKNQIKEIKARINDPDLKTNFKIADRVNELKNQALVLDYCFNKVDAVVSKFENNKYPDLENLTDIDIEELRSEIINIQSEINSLSKDNSRFKKIVLKEDLNKYLEINTWKNLKKEIITFKMYTKSELNYLSKQKQSSHSELISLFEEYHLYLLTKENNMNEINNLYNRILHYNKHSFYFKGGFTGRTFLYDLNNGANTIKERFAERGFQGTQFELGWSHQFKSYNFIGVNISKSYTDNSNLLRPRTFEFKIIDNTVTPSLEASSSITAISGTYDRFDDYQISADYVGLISLKDKSKFNYQKQDDDLFLNINPYFRHHFYSNSVLYNPNTSIGLGLYAFNVNKNTITGGVFFQANDIFNTNTDQAKNFIKQLDIGLVFKYSLSSFSTK
ncbi:hypothetical protein [Tenacibaculum sp. M341]|uniref:hypothetical protein n=1 Tax=Tenacibaculum sp. M341 TaxID=2530339 RepID=UPI0010515C61|nr:hypothetical protein [Tenacibaculum sp. M341]TCI90727.1 hypothetical protein EYW44_13480 [Tenacibaculum sp. M341]